ncbi:MAG TPA: hypothetical protein VN429_01460, partial [Methanospirillum sp.]|uniref:hypothetical protein n=1 Tax=Methanospirillum sp. TaxID=45200 RepID=UPI002BC8CE26
GEEKFKPALEIMREIGDKEGEASCFHELATNDLELGSYESALNESQQALILYEYLESPGDMADEFYFLGEIASLLDRPIGAIQLLGLSVHLYQSVNHPSTPDVLSILDQISSGYSTEQAQFFIQQTVEKFQAEGVAAVVDSIFSDHSTT